VYFLEHGKEHLDFIKGGKFVDYLSDQQLFDNGSAKDRVTVFFFPYLFHRPVF
jgi:hypothetical protein